MDKREEPAPAVSPAIRNPREAEHWLRIYAAERQAVLDALEALQQHFEAALDAPPTRLVRRRGGGLIWRLRSAAPSGQSLFALTSATGRNLLQTLTSNLQRLYLDTEADRLRLNMRYRIANTAIRSLTHYLDRYGQIRAIRKSLETK